MNGDRNPSFRTFGIVYILIISLILTAILSRVATHPGVSLAFITLATALLVAYRMRAVQGTERLIYIGVIIIVLLLGLLFITLTADKAELWLTTCYGIFDVLLAINFFIVSIRR